MLQPQNVLVVFDGGKPCLKLADFGASHSLAQNQTSHVSGPHGVFSVEKCFYIVETLESH